MLTRYALLILIIGALGSGSAPAVAKGGLGGLDLGDVGDFVGGLRGDGGGENYSNTPEVPFKGGCRVVNEPLYDDNDHVVAHQRVRECPAAPVLANCKTIDKPVYDSKDKVVAHQHIQQCPAQ